MKRARLIFGFLSYMLAVASLYAKRPAEVLADPREYALKSPTPPYPDKARVNFITGTGLFDVQIESATGKVVAVKVAKSTGSQMLDDSAVQTLHRWQFRPNSIITARIPITFSYVPRH